MSTPRWWFAKRTPGDRARDSLIGEFFRTDSDNVTALIREGIQNSLDARLRHGEPVRIRISLKRVMPESPGNMSLPFVDGLFEHVYSDRSGICGPAVGVCNILIFEDFETVGLTGDPGAWVQPEDGDNNFYHFFRAEGQSGKGEKDIGRWGVGKQVFVEASGIHSIFGLTVRADDHQKLLMGMSVIRSHDVDGVEYKPDGWMGNIVQSEHGEYVLPVSDSELLRQFEQFYGLNRDVQSGLSLVVPYAPDDLDMNLIASAVLDNYFWPIKFGELLVEIETPSQRCRLDSVTLVETLRRMGGVLRDRIAPMVELCDAYLLKTPAPVELHAPSDWKWNPESIESDALKRLRELFNNREVIALRINLSVARNRDVQRMTYFDLLLRFDGTVDSGPPRFIREGILIPQVYSNVPSALKGVRAVTVVSHEVLGAFLGDAENPAHTKWEAAGANFRGVYRNGPQILNFIKTSAVEITKILNSNVEQEYRDLVADYFSISLPESEAVPRSQLSKPGVKAGRKPERPTFPKPPRPLFAVAGSADGFTVRPADRNGQMVGKTIDLMIAYDVRRGNPFKKYRVEDFELSSASGGIRVDVTGAAIERMTRNLLRVRVDNEDYAISVHGFDKRRDVKVDIKAK